jgi:CheY-like chemotaxis protein
MPSGTPVLLLADDDRMIREAIGEELREHGYVVHLAADGQEALERAREVRPDILILDIVMPRLNGPQLSRLIRQEAHLRHVQIIALSAMGTLDFRWFAELSADFFVAKTALPETCRNLLAAIELLQSKGRDALLRRLVGDGRTAAPPRGVWVGAQPRLPGLLPALSEACARAFLELDGNGYILQATPLACAALGREEAELVGLAFPKVCAAGDEPMVQSLVEAAATSPASQRYAAVVTLGVRRHHVELLAVREPIHTLLAVIIPCDEAPPARDQPGSR